MTIGTLFGIGVGPGDPDLMTLKAVKALAKADVLFAAASAKEDHSTALTIAAPHLRPNIPTEFLPFPITSDRAAIAEAWAVHARRVLDVLGEGKSAAFITLGDPMLYSSFSYLLHELRAIAPDAPVEIIPGITSFQAAAAATERPLAEGAETLAVVPGHMGARSFNELTGLVDSAVLLKIYKKFPEIRQSLADQGLLSKSVLVSRLGHPSQSIERDLSAVNGALHYFSLILTRKNG